MHIARLVSVICFCFALSLQAATKVDFRDDGIVRVDGKPFFPIGCWVYGLDPAVLADLHEHRFNTVVGNGLAPSHISLLEKHGLMCMPLVTDDFLKAARNSSSLLAWYLTDEPEEHGETPQQVLAKYTALKAKDKDHPIGITHDTLHGPPQFKGACDFTMTDVYPVTKDRDWPLNAVGMYTDRLREVHGAGWPNFTFIQTFGGPESDGGKWAQPLPHEVRFMAFDALVHRASGILYFSYWPRAAATWDSITQLNKDIERLVPWLAAVGEERTAKASDGAIEVRAKKVEDSWMILAVNAQPRAIEVELSVERLGHATLQLPFDARQLKVENGTWRERFGAYEVKVYLVGEEPPLP